MKRAGIFVALFCVAFFSACLCSLVKADAPAAKPKTVAIFLKNRAKTVDDAKVTVLEDMITSKITDLGFHVLSREDTVNSVKSFANADPNVGDDAEPGAKLDAILSNNTSALRLSQNMGADYLFIASITTFGEKVNTVDTGDVHARITESTLRVSYKILDGIAGGSLTADQVTASTKKMEQPGATETGEVIDDLLDQASTKLAASLDAKVQKNAIADVAAAGPMPQFFVDCCMTDLAIPEVDKDDAGNYTIQANKYKIAVMSCTVEMDGVVVGTTPGPFSVGPGLHKIRVTREGFTEWNHTISVRDGMHLNVAMQLSPDGYARWRDNVSFLQEMKDTAKLNDAQVKKMEGMAKMFEQSGFRVDARSTSDVKSDVKINGTSLWPTVQNPTNSTSKP